MKILKLFIITIIIIFPASGFAQFTQADLAGTWYEHSLFSGSLDIWDRADWTIDETGNFTSEIVYADDDQETITGILTISEEGIITLADSDTFEGVMSSDKNIITFTDTYGDFYTLSILVKEDVPVASDDLIGNWYWHSLINGAAANWIRGTYNIDDEGNVTAEWIAANGATGNKADTIDLNETPSNPEFAVFPSDLEFAMSSDKNIFLFTFTGEDADTFGLATFFKHDAEYSLSDLEGTWYFHSLHVGADETWVRGTLVFDESGNYSLEWRGPDEISGDESGTVGIAEDGLITEDSETFQGTMSSDKNMIILTDTEETDTYALSLLTKNAEDVVDDETRSAASVENGGGGDDDDTCFIKMLKH